MFITGFAGQSRASRQKKEDVVTGQGTVLIMDDEEFVRKTLLRSLSSLGYHVEAAVNGEEALAIYERYLVEGKKIDVVILDLTIPAGMGGVRTMQRLKEIDPGVKAIVSSGYSNDPVMSDYKKYGFSDIMPKPYDIKTLSAVVSRVMGSRT